MRIVNYQQGSPSWLDWRKSKITATDAGSIMGHNPYKSICELYDEKMGFIPPTIMNKAMQRGHDLEPIARAIFIEQTGINMVAICCECESNYFMGASLDGWSEDNNTILEIKCPNIATHELSIQGGITEYYKDQMVHQLSISKADICYYMSYRPEHETPVVILEVFPDFKYTQKLIACEKEFYEDYLCSFVRPAEPWKMNLRK